MVRRLQVVAGSSLSAQGFARQPGLAMMLDLLGAPHVMLRWLQRPSGRFGAQSEPHRSV